MHGSKIAGVILALLLCSGCQTFRYHEHSPSQAEMERDEQVGQAVEVAGTTGYWIEWISSLFR